MAGRRPIAVASLAALAVAILGLAAWRAACVAAGPDVDTDAYAHHMIARAILADPRDLAVHWVWLPLFHYLQVPLVALGGTMDDVRWANVVLAAVVPIVLFGFVRRTATSEAGTMPPEATALLAALVAAACPIVMQMGTTAQPEPLFALLSLGVAITFQQRRYLAAAPLLGAAVVLRYEAWAMFAAVGVLVLVDAAWRARRGLAREPALWKRVVLLATPAVLVLAWAALRHPVDGQWFGFLGQTHEFAAQVVDGRDGTGGGASALRFVRDLLYYPFYVSGRVLGPALALAPFGLLRTWRQQGARFVLVLAAGLGFISLTWANHSTLGLDRHFVMVVPLYATFAAQGVAAIADRAAAWLAGRPPVAQIASRAVAGLLSLVVLGGLIVMLDVWMGFWRASIEHGWPTRAKLGAYLRTLPPEATIFCDDATLEILSGLDRRRFDRHWIDDPHTWELIDGTATERGVVYVATWRRKLNGHAAEGDLVFSAADAGQDLSSGVAVMRVLPDANRAAR